MGNEVWRLLLIDDNQADYVRLRELLSTLPQRQIQFDYVADYEAGLQAMQRCHHDLYLLDYFLGPRSGLDLLRAARQAGCAMPVIMLTGQSDHDRDLEAMRAGASDYLVKGEVTATLLERSIRYALDRHRVEEQLAASQEELQEAQRIAHLGSWTWDLQADVITWSDEMYRIYGAQPQEFAVTVPAYLERAHPDDRAYISKLIEKVCADHVPFDYSHRLVRPDGAVRQVHGWGDVITDDEGTPIKMFGAEQDITERQQSEQMLQLTQDQLHAILDVVPGTVSWIDADLKYRGINQFLARLHGLPPEYFIGRPVGFRDNDTAFVHFVQDFFASPAKTITREVTLRAGERDAVYFMVAQKYDEDRAAVFMGLDITERKQAEAALQQAHDELEARVEARTTELAIANHTLQAEIGERQQAAKEARAGEQLYRTLIHNFPNGAVLLFDHDLRYTVADGAAMRNNGKTSADFESKTIWEATAPTVAETLEPYYRAALAGESHTFETPIGKHFYLIQTLPVKDESGLILAGMSIAQDITRHHYAEQRRNMRHTVTELLSQEVSLKVTIADVLQVIAEGMDWDYGAFWQVNPTEQELRCFQTWHMPSDELKHLAAANAATVLVAGQCYLGEVWATGRPLWVDDLTQAATAREALRATQFLRGGAVFPVRFGSEILGVMEFFSDKSQPHDAEVLNTLEGFGSQIGQFMERQRAQDALRASEALKSAILGSSLDAVLTMDHEGHIIDWNPAAERIFGYRRDEALGCGMIDLILAPTADERHLGLLRRYLETGEGPFNDQHLEFTARHAEGHEFPIELGISRLQFNGHPLYTAYAHDMTGRQRAAHALQQAKDEADQALIEAERANRAKSAFLSRMSHELRTPMNSILGFGQLLQMEALAPKQQQKVEHILKAGEHLLGLINEVLDIARVEAGRLSLSLEPVRVADIIRESLSLVEPLAGRRHIQFETQPAMLCECSILADRQRLQQVLMNLLSNAIKYNREGGQVEVDCVADKAQHCLSIRVRDTGAGLDASDIARLFQPFERLGAEATNIEGSGLGLSLSKHFVEAMKGTIGVESVVGQGSVFWVTLPLAEDQLARHEESGGHALASAQAAVAQDNVGTVLYIEDNLANLLVVESILSYQCRIRLITAMQGGLGLELAREHHPALILLDLHLPDMAGSEVLSRLKSDSLLRDIPVLVLSADATPGQIARLKEQGACNYLTKPLDVQHFLDVINEIL